MIAESSVGFRDSVKTTRVEFRIKFSALMRLIIIFLFRFANLKHQYVFNSKQNMCVNYVYAYQNEIKITRRFPSKCTLQTVEYFGWRRLVSGVTWIRTPRVQKGREPLVQKKTDVSAVGLGGKAAIVIVSTATVSVVSLVKRVRYCGQCRAAGK